MTRTYVETTIIARKPSRALRRKRNRVMYEEVLAMRNARRLLKALQTHSPRGQG